MYLAKVTIFVGLLFLAHLSGAVTVSGNERAKIRRSMFRAPLRVTPVRRRMGPVTVTRKNTRGVTSTPLHGQASVGPDHCGHASNLQCEVGEVVHVCFSYFWKNRDAMKSLYSEQVKKYPERLVMARITKRKVLSIIRKFSADECKVGDVVQVFASLRVNGMRTLSSERAEGYSEPVITAKITWPGAYRIYRKLSEEECEVGDVVQVFPGFCLKGMERLSSKQVKGCLVMASITKSGCYKVLWKLSKEETEELGLLPSQTPQRSRRQPRQQTPKSDLPLRQQRSKVAPLRANKEPRIWPPPNMDLSTHPEKCEADEIVYVHSKDLKRGILGMDFLNMSWKEVTREVKSQKNQGQDQETHYVYRVRIIEAGDYMIIGKE